MWRQRQTTGWEKVNVSVLLSLQGQTWSHSNAEAVRNPKVQQWGLDVCRIELLFWRTDRCATTSGGVRENVCVCRGGRKERTNVVVCVLHRRRHTPSPPDVPSTSWKEEEEEEPAAYTELRLWDWTGAARKALQEVEWNRQAAGSKTKKMIYRFTSLAVMSLTWELELRYFEMPCLHSNLKLLHSSLIHTKLSSLFLLFSFLPFLHKRKNLEQNWI